MSYNPVKIGTKDIDFKGYKAIALACDKGTTFPSAPTDAQWFYRSDLLVLFTYTNSSWQALCSFGTLNLYVDGTLGSDSVVTNGYASGSSAVLTINKAVSILPKLIGGNVTINVAAGIYREQVGIYGVKPQGSFNVIIKGETTQLLAPTTATGGGTVSTITVTGANWTANQFQYKLLKITSGAGSGQDRIILSNTSNTITVQCFATTPNATSVFEVHDWATRVTGSNAGTDTTASRQYCFYVDSSMHLTISYLAINYFSGAALRALYGSSAITVTSCNIHNGTSATNGGVTSSYTSYVVIGSSYIHDCVIGATAYGSSSLNFGTSICRNNSKYGIYIWGTSALPFLDSSLIDSNTTAGILVRGSSSLDLSGANSTATQTTISNNGTGIILDSGGSVINKTAASLVITYSGNTNGDMVNTVNGGVDASRSLIIDSTTHATKGNITIAPNGGNVGIGLGAVSPSYPLDVNGKARAASLKVDGILTGANNFVIDVNARSEAGIFNIAGIVTGANDYTKGFGVNHWFRPSNTTYTHYGLLMLPAVADTSGVSTNITNIFTAYMRTDIVSTYTGTITNLVGLHIDNPYSTAGPSIVGSNVTNNTGLVIADMVAGTTSNWSMKIGSAPSYHKGKFRIGDSTYPQEMLEVAGTGVFKKISISDSSATGFLLRNTGATFDNIMSVGGIGNPTIGANWTIAGTQSDLTKPSWLISPQINNDQFIIQRAAAAGAGTVTLVPFLTINNTGNTTIAGTITGAGITSTSTITAKQFIDTVYAPAAGTSFTIDISNGMDQEITTSGNTTITLPAPSAGKSYTITVKYGGAHTITWAGGGTIKWTGGTAPLATSTTGKYDIYVFKSDATGTYTFGADGGRNY